MARRLSGVSDELMEWDNIPTTVFTPLEFATCGMSEELAISKFGKDKIEVYHSHFTPNEWTLAHRLPDNSAVAKVICNKAENEKIVGIHLIGPNAGDVLQGFAVGMK